MENQNAAKKRKNKLGTRRKGFIIAFLAPTLIAFCVFYLYPIITVFITSFCKWDYTNITSPEFFGWSNLWDNYDYIFTKEQENAVIDFIIKGDELHIVQLKAVKRFSKPRYRVRDTSSYIIQQSISRCENADDYYWTNSTKLTVVNFDWCIVTKDFNITHSNYPSFEFQYGGVEYNLCYIINPAA